MLIALFTLSLIAGKLLQLQGLQSNAYASVADSQGRTTVVLTAARGRILDRSGHVLADTVAADDIDATPSLIKNKHAVAAQLAPVVQVPAATLFKDLSVKGSDYARLVVAGTAVLAKRVTALALPGIYAAATTKRVYPDGSIASNVLGDVSEYGTGLGGLESEDNAALSGVNGKHTYQAGTQGNPIPGAYNSLVPAKSGTTFQLSLQQDIQWEAQQAISAEVKKSHAKDGFVVVEVPQTGQILALADAHSYNFNNASEVTPRHLDDSVVENTYEPGSVNKVVTMSAALEEGLVKPTSHFVVPPVIEQGGQPFHDAEPHGYEDLTLTGILAESSNIGTIEVARKLGAKTLDKYLLKYGYAQPTNIGLPSEAAGTLLPLNEWSATTMPTVAFGQGIGVSALQVASIYSTIADGGVRVHPNLVEATIDSAGKRTAAPAPTKRRIISHKVARELSDMLESVVTREGTAPQAEIAGYRVAGKTGTALIPNPNRPGYETGAYTGSFVGFAPADKPRLVVEAVVSDPRKGPFYGAEVAGPVFKQVMSFALQTLHIPPTGTKPPKAKLTW